MISILIPVQNGGDDLRRCLDVIARQQVDDDVETIIVDHHSRDGTPEFARSRGAHVLEIGDAEFGHGATRNLAAREARGEILVFTVKDAYADDELWLSRLRDALLEQRDPGRRLRRQADPARRSIAAGAVLPQLPLRARATRAARRYSR